MPYDLSEVFEKIEDELIGSMMRNLDRHRAEETKLGYNWEQWQAVQLKALEDYRKTNAKKFPPRYNKLNNQIRTILQDSFNDGSTKQERRILQAIKRGFKVYGANAPAFAGNVQTQGAFFTVNDRKLNALIESTLHDMEKAEYAVLRRADDQYRQIIYNAQVYANTGAGTYEKAVDMAGRDFLRAGINSVEYKNGSRHTISDYADMAIKTAAKRAYLQGEGEMRRGWGISTVILNKRSCPCPLCAPFVGKIFIDDVWSGGTAEEAKEKGYPLLSEAIAQGLYHPRCKDVHTTYFEGITTSEESYSKKELDEQKEKYTAEEKQAYCKRQEKRFSRMSKYSLDADNRRMYAARAKEWNEKAKAENSVKTVENAGESGIIVSGEVSQMSIHSIDLPIEQRNTGKGKPNAVLTFGVELNNRQKRLLELLPDFDSRAVVPKKSVNMSDLSALTAFTGDEFAMFTKDGKRLIVRGNAVSVKINIDEAKRMSDNGYRWSGHTHPGIDFLSMQPSDGDYSILDCFDQMNAVIYNSKGDYRTFEKRG